MKDNKIMPGLVILGVALVLFVSALAAHGSDHHSVGIGLGCASAVLFIVSGAWFVIEHRRVRSIEERWYADHPDAYRQRPSS